MATLSVDNFIDLIERSELAPRRHAELLLPMLSLPFFVPIVPAAAADHDAGVRLGDRQSAQQVVGEVQFPPAEPLARGARRGEPDATREAPRADPESDSSNRRK